LSPKRTKSHIKTRKLGYRKDDRAMSTPTAAFAEIFNGLLFWSILCAYKIWSS